MNTYHSYQWTDASRQDARKYQVGDVLAFHKDSAGFAKGEYVAFEERRGEKIVVRDEQGRRFSFPPSEMEGFDVGLSRSLPVSIGERLLIRANLKEHKLFNGNIVEVAGVREDGTIVLKDKRTIPPQFRQFSHGYATTSHAAQGKTINRGIVLMAGEGIKAANLRQAYVSHSRFEESHVTYTTNRRAAMNAMATPAERALATRGSHALVSAATFLKTFQLERELEASFHALGEIVFRTGLDAIGGEYGRVLVDVNVGANTDKRRFPRVFRGGNGERPDTSAVEL
jgi:hypothetical protein